MPYKPKKPCKHPGCANLTDGRYCDKHKTLHSETVRAANKRGYGSRWQKVSTSYLREHHLCVECLKRGKNTQATVVDHVVPHRGDAKLFWDKNNWQPLCKQCHDTKTGREDSNPTYTY
nr:MAG TPA: HNH endonuclease [Caudoviricetes sp.]